MLGLKFRLEGLYFTTFRKPLSTSLIISYSIPPYTTIRGLIANAMGLERDNLSIQEWIKIGIKPLKFPERSREMAKLLKLKGADNEYKRVFPSSPIFKEYLVSPAYELYIAGDDEKIDNVYHALLEPARPLYIGGSDELVDIEPLKPAEIREVNTKEVTGVAEGIHEGCFVEKIPYKFIKKGKNFSLEYKTVSVPLKGRMVLQEEVKCWQFDGENVWMV